MDMKYYLMIMKLYHICYCLMFAESQPHSDLTDNTQIHLKNIPQVSPFLNRKLCDY